MHFKQKVPISTLCSKPIKLVDQFTYLGSDISSTESDISSIESDVKGAECYEKIIDHMQVWSIRSIKTKFLPRCSCVHTIIWMHLMDANKAQSKKTSWKIHKNTVYFLEQILYLWTQDVAYKTWQVRWMIGMDGERVREHRAISATRWQCLVNSSVDINDSYYLGI